MTKIKFTEKHALHFVNFLIKEEFKLPEKDSVLLAKEVVFENQSYKERYKISLLNHGFIVHANFINNFLVAISTGDHSSIHKHIATKPPLVEYTPVISMPKGAGEATVKSEDLVQNARHIELRLNGLLDQANKAITKMVTRLNEQMTRVAKDSNIVKDFDGYITFDMEIDPEIKFSLCFDKVPPVGQVGQINRTAITKEDADLYLGNAYPVIAEQLKFISDLCNNFLNSKTVTVSDASAKHARSLLNGTLACALVEQTIEFISFGGVDNFAITAEGNPNTNACYVYLDAQVEALIKRLEDIPLVDDVELYSIDVDTFNVYGRTNDNKVVTAILPNITDEILSQYSKGFERLFSSRLANIDNPHFFRA